LRAFINELRDESDDDEDEDGRLAQEQTAGLIAAARRIRAVLAC
jgi:hypothetical protein